VTKADEAREWRKRNPDKVRAYAAAYIEKNRDRRAIASKKWREKNRQHVADYAQRYRAVNLDLIHARAKDSRARNPKTAEQRIIDKQRNAARRQEHHAEVLKREAQHRERNRESIRARDKAARQRNAQIRRTEKLIYLATHRDQIEAAKTERARRRLEKQRVYAKKWRDRNRDRTNAKNWARLATPSAKAKARAYYEAHKDRWKASYVKREADPEKVRQRKERARKYYNANSEKWSLRPPDPAVRRRAQQRYAAKNKAKLNAKVMARHAMIKNAVIGDKAQIEAFYFWLKTAESIPCAYCGTPTGKGKDRHADHVVPLSRGGKHCVDNLVPSCASCNRRKGDKFWKPAHVANRPHHRDGERETLAA
jgi:hypothetical protein